MSNESVQRKTGRDWQAWFRELDAANANELDHKGIVAILASFDVDPWWQQMITVQYELERGLRKPNQQGSTFQISRSKTIDASPELVFEAWEDNGHRNSWLGVDIEIRKSTPNRSLRLRWADDTPVDVYIESLREGRSRMSVQQSKLSEDQVEERKRFWTGALVRLKEYVESTLS